MIIDISIDRSERVKYDYSDFAVYIRKGLLSVFPNYTADSHWHDDIELIAVLSGQMLYNVNGNIITLNKGEGLFINSRQLHYGFSTNKTDCEFICILFHPILLCSSGMFENQYVMPILNGTAAYIHLSPNILWQNKILKCIEDICDKKDEKAAPLHTYGQLYLLWSQIASNLNFEIRKANDTRLTLLKNMIAYIHKHYQEKISLKDIALHGHISKRTCGTIFLEYLNKTPIEFLINYRLRKSIELMKNTDMTILEISLEVGFSGASYYSETFRKHFGKSPVEYRKCL